MMKNLTVIIMASNKDLSLWIFYILKAFLETVFYWFVEVKILKVLSRQKGKSEVIGGE